MSNRYALLLGMQLILLSARAYAGNTTYIYTDPLGTPLAEADSTGNMVLAQEYSPTGAVLVGSSTLETGFTGHVFDPNSNLIYMQARYYDPDTGIFLSTDAKIRRPGDFKSFSRYSYADANPISNLDPDGNSTFCGAYACDVFSSGFNQVTSKGQARYLASRFFNHYYYNGPKDGGAKTTLPKATKKALVKIIMSPIGGRLVSSMASNNERIDLVYMDAKDAFGTFGNEIWYTPSVGDYLYTHAESLFPGDGADSTSLDILLMHEFGHSDAGHRAFGFEEFEGDKLNIREEMRAVKSFENPYRKFKGVPIRCTYFVENDLCK
ncbi:MULTISPECIES: RHS repeat domain-containing protein [Dyella]|uniref:Teneurin-like YD-shell domain-containing protein n=2 Tax=Dyella TaxID=231454 RepID=A0A4R0YUB2_9GAMM|nr:MULTISPECIES: RHS repeat-associated core domain-containing protein [Dyella]TBR39410.1 hypothetical protein EYV96_04110 [Dyella terrae]TCI13003.1 hypothetical protein EZM97_06755 [Dyella soli]